VCIPDDGDIVGSVAKDRQVEKVTTCGKTWGSSGVRLTDIRCSSTGNLVHPEDGWSHPLPHVELVTVADVKFKLVPTDDRFFQLYSDGARNATVCAAHLRGLLASGDGAGFEDVRSAERQGDRITKEILQRLDSSFVTPFDREDIHALAEKMDDVVDDMFHVAELVQLMRPQSHLSEVAEMADVLMQMAEHTVTLLDGLEAMKGLKPELAVIDELESKGDAIYRRAVARLFSGDYEPLEVLKWKDIVTALEDALNTLEDVSDVVESILFKHA
jgi:predicted phosphate transport protein (TIGR00153 family)